MNFTGGSKCTSKTKHIEDQQIQFGAQNRFVPICEIKPFIDVNLLKSNVRVEGVLVEEETQTPLDFRPLLLNNQLKLLRY